MRPGRPRVQRRLHLLVGVVLVCAVVAVNAPPIVGFVRQAYHQWEINRASYKRQFGHWAMLDVPSKMRINGIHAVLLYTGKVLIVAGSGNNVDSFTAGKFETRLWDPRTNVFKKIPTPSDLFCGGHVVLPDGKVLIVGGVQRYEVLHSQVRYAAGVMTITNVRTPARTVLPIGTTFVAPDGHVYQSTVPATVPGDRAHQVRAGGRRRWIVAPGMTQVWVKAVNPGDDSVIRRLQNYSVKTAQGAPLPLTATAYSISRDEQTFWGSRRSYLFDPATERYEATSDLQIARWYPSLVRLTSGKVLAVSGLDGFGQIIAGRTEVWDPQTEKWTIDEKLTKPFPTYPALFLMPNGNLFFTGASAGFGPNKPGWRTPGIWNPATNAFKPVPGLRDPNITETAGSVLLPPAQKQRYAIIGGGGVGESNAATGRIDVADLSSRTPRWRTAGQLPVPARYPEVVTTPDDRLVISGGSRFYRGERGSDLLECHLYDPRTGALTKLADPIVGRDYHAAGLLLPDGRILTLGGNPLFGDKYDSKPGFFEQRISIFSPPYLYHGRRPRLTAGPQQLATGGTGVFSTPDGAHIVSARLMRPSATTHVTDLEQRSIALGLKRTPSGISVTVPRGAGLVPPGWYMLFVLNRAGVPSIARWVNVSS